MAKGSGLNFKTKVDIAESKARLLELKKLISDVGGINTNTVGKSFDTRPLTEYQSGILKIKQETLDLAKAKQEQQAADRSASLAIQAALREEAKLKREQISAEKALKAEQSKRSPTQVSNSQAEIDAYKKAQQGSILYTSAINAERVARAQLNVEAAKQAIANGTLSNTTASTSAATNANTDATNKNALSKKQLAQMLAEEKLRQQQSNAELRNNAKEMLNAKGSVEQRKAALERLIITYNRLSAAERESTAGTRLSSIISGLRDQLKAIDDQTKSSKDGIAGLFDYLKGNIVSILGPIALLTAAWNAAKAAFSHTVEISDNFTDVQRTAKLSKEEVSDFGNELKKLDTRTSLEGLLDIGFIGGRLAVPKDELKDFVKQVDELAVVLKKEFPGGAEAVAESLGKIVTIYKVTQKEGVSLGTALSKVGSNLLELAHSGPVTVKYLQDFTLGVAGTAVSAKLSIPVIAAYGAVLGESGQIASSSALAVTRLVNGLTTKPGKFAAIAQLADSSLTVEKFTKVVNTDTKQALDLFFKGLKAGNPVATEFASRLESVGIKTGKVSNAVKILAENQDKLAEKIVIGGKGYEKAATVAHNFELANDNLAASVDKLHNTAVNLVTDPNSSLAGFFKGIIDGSTYALKAISDLDDALTKTQLQKDRELVERTKPSLFNAIFNPLADKTGLEEAKARLKANASQVLNNEIAGKGYASADIMAANKDEAQIRSLLVRELNNRKIAQDKLANALAFVSNPKNTEAQTATVEKNINKLREAARQQNAVVDRLKAKLPKDSTIYGDGSLVQEDGVRTTEDIKAEIKALVEANKKLGTETQEFKKNVKQIVALKKELRLANGGKDTEAISAENKYQTALKSRNDLQGQIDLLTKKGVDKQLSADDQELESVRNKYNKMREEANKFNNDPGNKKKGLRVDSGGLVSAQSKEEDSLRDKQAAVKLKVSLDEQKKLYDEYESYKDKVGKENADKRYAKLLNTDKTYLESLEIQRAAITDPQKGKGGSEEDIKSSQERLKVLDKEISDEKIAQSKKQDQLLADFMSYADERKALTEKYQHDLEIIGDNPGSREKRTQRYNEELKELDFENLKKLESYEALFKGIDSLSEKSALKQIEFARKQLDKDVLSGAITDPAEIAKIKAYFDQVEQTIRQGSGKALQDLGSEIGKVAGAVSGVNEEFGKMLTVIGDVVSKVGDIKSGIKDFNIAKGKNDGLGQLTAGLGIFGAGISVFSSVFKLFDKSAQREEQAAYARDLQIKQTEAVTKALDRQLQLINEVYGTEKLAKYASALVDISNKQKDLNGQLGSKYQLSGFKNFDDIITQINSGGDISKFEAFIKSNQAAFDALKLPINDLNKLQNLLDQGKLDEKTAAIVNSLITLEKQANDTFNALNAEKVGSTLDSIADGFVNTLTDGIQDIGKSFEDIIRTSLINGFKGQLIQNQLQAFYKQFAQLADGGLTETEISTLRDTYTKAADKAKKDLEDLQKATGIDLTNKNSNTSSSLAKNITSITSDQASALEGITRGTFDQTKQIVVQAALTNSLLIPIGKTIGDFYLLAKSNFDNTVAIRENTAQTVARLDSAITELKAINKNTTGSSIRGAGLG